MTQFFISFSVGCILIGALYIICPEGNISKPIRYLFSLVFLVIIISAANIPLKKITFPLPEATASQASLTEMQSLSAQYIYSYTLEAQNINFREIYVCTDNSNDNSIVITKVIIVSDEPREKIIKALGVLAKEREVEIVNE